MVNFSRKTFCSGCRKNPSLPMPCQQTSLLYFSTSETALPHPKQASPSPILCLPRFVCGSHFAPCFFRRKKLLISEMATIFSSTSETGIHIRNMPVFSFVEAILKSPNAFCLLTFFRVSFVERREN